MIAALLLIAVGATDLVAGLIRSRARPATASTRTRADLAAGVVVAIVVGALAWLTVGVPVVVALGIAVVAAGWAVAAWAFSARDRSAPLFVATALVALLVVTALAAEPLLPADGALVRAYREFALEAGIDLPPALLAGYLAVGLVLTRTANLICRAALGRTLAADRPAQVGERRRWVLTRRSREIVTVSTDDAPATRADGVQRMRGGRVIGPLERLLITALALLGSEALIVGLLAAKGIVRFPEISADGRTGSKAEEFLVGSLVSWSLAALAVAFLAVLRGTGT